MYDELYLRNKGYVSDELQEKIRATKVLVAGCGIGSMIAECAMRIGFENLTLADGDDIEIHNLNRQAYSHGDIGKKKVTALAKRLKGINPEAPITAFPEYINHENVKDLVSNCDMIYDTIDFLDMPTITALHDEANRQNKPLFSAVSIGWGGAVVYFKPTGAEVCMFRKLFQLPDEGPVPDGAHTEFFPAFIEKIRSSIDPESAAALADTFHKMANGIPCPAPHVAAGSMTVATLMNTMAVRVLKGDDVLAAPYLCLANMGAISSQDGLNLAA